MSKKVKYILLGLLIIASLAFGYAPVSNIVKKAKAYGAIKKEKEEIEKKIKEQGQIIVQLNKENERLEKKSDSLISLADSSAKLQIQLQNEIDEKKKIIATMRKNLSVDELDDFWGSGSN